jgi:hypothetical protein
MACIAGGLTFMLAEDRKGYSCLSNTNTRATLSSFLSSSKGVSLIYSTFKWRSWLVYRMLGESFIMSSKNSVSSKAALLYFY